LTNKPISKIAILDELVFREPTPFDLFTISETAAILGVSYRSVSNWIKQDALPAIRLGPEKHLIRIRVTDLEAFIDQGTLSPPHMRTPNVNDHPDDLPTET